MPRQGSLEGVAYLEQLVSKSLLSLCAKILRPTPLLLTRNTRPARGNSVVAGVAARERFAPTASSQP